MGDIVYKLGGKVRHLAMMQHYCFVFILLLMVTRVFAKEQTGEAEDAYKINMCYFCDSTCRTTLGMSVAATKTYLDKVTQQVQMRLQNLLGSSTSIVRHGFVHQLNPPTKSYLIFKSGKFHNKGVDLVSHIGNNFWRLWKPSKTGGKTLNDYFKSNGCDVNVLMVSRYDNLWIDANAGAVDGAATSFGICTDFSYITVKTKNDAAEMGTIISHEIGHLLGLYHDGALNSGWVSECRDNMYSECRVLKEKCTAKDHGCEDGQGNCVMNAAMKVETAFSECSAAYLAGFKAMIRKRPEVYSMDCIKQ